MNKVYKSSCHCQAVNLELVMPQKIDTIVRCNCSICSKKGAIITFVAKDNLKIIKGESKLSKYTFNTHVAEHYFCSICGIHTHNKRRTDPNFYGVNMNCIDDINLEDYKDVKYFDGKNHPLDK